eukprot:CAMPEP_0194025962 /NCGR_PEP_ID=MMETSP0009_2-20130614/268_1 /TAXON_ID=210454 /ORGANISM="Grammatophora oceanica, Strain CCMP 410" /LENGTH=45 /DNA_ID= /DNA_START= /DNA_END= /DNA_ORIENTATION=
MGKAPWTDDVHRLWKEAELLRKIDFTYTPNATVDIDIWVANDNKR